MTCFKLAPAKRQAVNTTRPPEHYPDTRDFNPISANLVLNKVMCCKDQLKDNNWDRGRNERNGIKFIEVVWSPCLWIGEEKGYFSFSLPLLLKALIFFRKPSSTFKRAPRYPTVHPHFPIQYNTGLFVSLAHLVLLMGQNRGRTRAL